MRIAVVESNPAQREDLARRILKLDSNSTIEVFESRDQLRDFDFEIFYLDICGVDGMSIAREIRRRKIHSVIIFVTGFREFMEDAFDVNAFHYLLKPIDSERFEKIFNRAVEEVSEFHRSILIRAGGISRKIFVSEIFYIESDDKRIRIHLENSTVETYSTMDSIESELGSRFFRCHRCFIVNLEKIVSYSSSEIELSNGDRILLSRNKSREFRKIFLHYIRC